MNCCLLDFNQTRTELGATDIAAMAAQYHKKEPSLSKEPFRTYSNMNSAHISTISLWIQSTSMHYYMCAHLCTIKGLGRQETLVMPTKNNILKGAMRLYMLVLLLESTVRPEIKFTSSVTEFDSQEEATLLCTANGGLPAIYNISLIKNGQVIHNKSSDELIYTTSGGLPRRVYGLYDCNVSNTAGTVSETLFLQHKGD